MLHLTSQKRLYGLSCRACLAAVGLLLLAASACQAAPQAPDQAAPPRYDAELALPDDPPQPGGGRKVLVKDAAEELVVGRVLVEVGEKRVVMLPTGSLIAAATRETTETDRPFEPASKEQVLTDLTRRFKGFKGRSTRRYVYIYNTSEPFYKAASSILETMYPNLLAYFKRQKFEVHEPEFPLVVLMFRTEGEFQQFKAMPEGVPAYYHGVSNWVVMYEQSRLAEVAPELALKASISTIAHEGAHQVLSNLGVQERLSEWPLWISEGLADYFAPTQADKNIRWKGVGLPNDIRLYSLQAYLKEHRLKKAGGGALKELVAANALDADGYATAWGLTHYLARYKSEAFFDYLRELQKLGPLEKPPEEGVPMFTKAFGDDFAALETAVVKHLQKLPYVDPVENQTHYVAMWTVPTRKDVVVSPSPAAIRQWRQQQADRLQPAEQGLFTFQVQAYPTRAAAEAFARAWIVAP
jgi:hypothetical protein